MSQNGARDEDEPEDSQRDMLREVTNLNEGSSLVEERGERQFKFVLVGVRDSQGDISHEMTKLNEGSSLVKGMRWETVGERCQPM